MKNGFCTKGVVSTASVHELCSGHFDYFFFVSLASLEKKAQGSSFVSSMVVSWFSYRHSKRLSDVSAHRSFSANRNSSKSTFLHVEKFKPNEREKKHTMQPSYAHIGKD